MQAKTESLEKKLGQMVLAANLSIYFYYASDDFRGLESFSKKWLRYITKAEQLFEEIVQENQLNPTELIDLHLKMGKACVLLKLETDIIKYYTFVTEKQNGLLKNQGYQKELVENLGDNIVILMKAHLRWGESFEPSASLLSNKYARKSYLKALEVADNTPDCMFEKQKSMICYYAGLACRYIAECYEREKNYTQSLPYYLKAMEAHSNIINGLAPHITNKHTPIVQELSRGYRRLYSLYQKGEASLTDIQTGLETLELGESEKIISSKKAVFNDKKLISHFYQAKKNMYELLEINLKQTPTQFWRKPEDNQAETIPNLREGTRKTTEYTSSFWSGELLPEGAKEKAPVPLSPNSKLLNE